MWPVTLATNTEHAGDEPDREPDRKDDEDIDRQVGDRKIDLHDRFRCWATRTGCRGAGDAPPAQCKKR
jgi:hypothetical protein